MWHFIRSAQVVSLHLHSLVSLLRLMQPTQISMISWPWVVFTLHKLLFFCRLVQRSVTRALDEYLYTDYPKSKLLSRDRFEDKLDSEVKAKIHFIKTYVYHASLEAIQFSSKFHSISALYTFVDTDITADGNIRMKPSRFFNCSCITNPETCSTDAAFYAYLPSNNTLELLFKVLGLQLACSPSRSALLSSFACWYSSECYQQVNIFHWHSSDSARYISLRYSSGDLFLAKQNQNLLLHSTSSESKLE